MQTDARKLTVKAAEITADTGFFIIPAFVGLAVVSPVLLPMLVGPGWEASIPLSQMLCLAVAFSLPFNFYYSGYSALGRPEYGLYGSALSLLTMVVVFLACAWAGLPQTVGIAFISYEVAKVVIALALALPISGRALTTALIEIVRIWIGALIMAAILHWLFLSSETPQVSGLELAGIVLAGMVVYPLVMLVVCPRCMRDFVRMIRSR